MVDCIKNGIFSDLRILGDGNVKVFCQGNIAKQIYNVLEIEEEYVYSGGGYSGYQKNFGRGYFVDNGSSCSRNLSGDWYTCSFNLDISQEKIKSLRKTKD